MLFPIPQAAFPQNLPDVATDALKKVTGGITDVLGAIFNPVEPDFHSAVQERRFDEALKIFVCDVFCGDGHEAMSGKLVVA